MLSEDSSDWYGEILVSMDISWLPLFKIIVWQSLPCQRLIPEVSYLASQSECLWQFKTNADLKTVFKKYCKWGHIYGQYKRQFLHNNLLFTGLSKTTTSSFTSASTKQISSPPSNPNCCLLDLFLVGNFTDWRHWELSKRPWRKYESLPVFKRSIKNGDRTIDLKRER